MSDAMEWERTDIGKVIRQISAFTKWTGANVLSTDEPSNRGHEVGWIAFYLSKDGTKETSRRFYLSLPELKRSIETLENNGDEVSAVLAKQLKTGPGRRAIAEAIPGQRKDGEAPTFQCKRCGAESWVKGMTDGQHSKRECDRQLIWGVHEE